MKLIYISISILVLAVGGIGAYLLLKPTETDLLFEQCKDAMNSLLVSPKSATYGEYTFTSMYKFNGTYQAEQFTFNVDSKNKFGVELSKRYVCYLRYKKGTFYDVQIDIERP